MRASFLALLVLCLAIANARKDSSWDSMFDVPSGFRSYQAQRAVGHRPTLDDMSLGFEGFLDEGVDAEAPDQTPETTTEPEHHTHKRHHTRGHASHNSHPSHHKSHHHHHHHDKFSSFLQVGEQYVDPALAEAEKDAEMQAPKIDSTKVDVPHNLAPQIPAQPVEDQPADRIDLVSHAPAAKPFPKHQSESLEFDTSKTDVDSLLGSGGFEIHNVDELRASLAQLEEYIRERRPHQPTLTDTLTSATQSGLITTMLPRVSLRTGLTPGVLPGLVDSASTTAAILPSLVGNNLAKNVKEIAQLQLQPNLVNELQAKLPSIMPDLPQLHPMGQTFPQAATPSLGSMLEVEQRSAHGAKSSLGLREDQAVDLQYLRGIGQGLEMIASVFGSGDPRLQAEAMSAAEALKSVGTGTTNGQAFLQVEERVQPGIGNDYRAPPAYPARSNVKGANFASGPSYPQNPQAPGGELDWMLDGMEAKGYGGTREKMSFDRVLQSAKGFFKKGVEFMGNANAAPPASPKDPKESPTDGFGGWPQPFWWTKPPAWIDEIPGWMQRLQMKKSQSSHKFAAFG